MSSRLPERVLFLAAWATFIFWTVRRFWWPTKDSPSAALYRQSRLLGPLMTVLAAFLFSSQIDLPELTFWPAVAFWGVIAFPIIMWTMFFALQSIHAVLGRLLP